MLKTCYKTIDILHVKTFERVFNSLVQVRFAFLLVLKGRILDFECCKGNVHFHIVCLVSILPHLVRKQVNDNLSLIVLDQIDFRFNILSDSVIVACYLLNLVQEHLLSFWRRFINMSVEIEKLIVVLFRLSLDDFILIVHQFIFGSVDFQFGRLLGLSSLLLFSKLLLLSQSLLFSDLLLLSQSLLFGELSFFG